MRLIHTGMKELVEWHGEENRPPYAILSHTWSENDSEEVTFQELKAAISPNPSTPIDAIISKPGYDKIRNFCDEAIRRGYDWVWVDTCCINKESSSELSEAINSMYRWYEQSALCIAYLADVQASSINLTDLNSESNSEFRKSRWFTRGWTLQELIAPRTLEFYNESWERIGDRLALAPFIGEICGLPRDLLSSKKKPSEYSIAQRMSWAAKRRTKRVEDRTYCLLGLFEINMPLIYGEADAAFQRLQKKIIKKSNDQTIFAWGFCLPDEMVLSSGSPQLMSILADSPDSFEGCGDIIPYLHNSLTIWDYSYQLTKEGIHMAIIYVGDPTSIDKSRLIDILFCTREKGNSRIGLRIHAYNIDKKPVPPPSLDLSYLSQTTDRSRKNYIIMGRIAGCRPLEDITDAIMLESSYIPEAFLAIDPPYSLDQTPRTEEIPTVTISPYGTVIIPHLRGMKFEPLPHNESRVRIKSYNGYFTTISKCLESRQERSPFEVFFTCSLADHGTAHAGSAALYMMIDDRRIPQFLNFSLPIYFRSQLFGARCRFAQSELEAGNLSIEKLRSLPWAPTTNYDDKEVSARETHRNRQSNFCLFSFTLNKAPLKADRVMDDFFGASVARLSKLETILFQARKRLNILFLLFIINIVLPPVLLSLIAYFFLKGKHVSATIFIYFITIANPFTRLFPSRFRSINWVKLAVLLFPILPLLVLVGSGIS